MGQPTTCGCFAIVIAICHMLIKLPASLLTYRGDILHQVCDRPMHELQDVWHAEFVCQTQEYARV